MEFINKPQKWDNMGVQPPESLSSGGFVAGYKPPAAYFNYLFNNYYKCIEELQNAMKSIGNEGTTSVILKRDSWDGEEAPYSVTFPMEGLTNQEVRIMPGENLSNEQFEIIAGARITCGSIQDGAITLYAYGKVPEIDITVTMMIVERGKQDSGKLILLLPVAPLEEFLRKNLNLQIGGEKPETGPWIWFDTQMADLKPDPEILLHLTEGNDADVQAEVEQKNYNVDNGTTDENEITDGKIYVEVID